MSSIFDATCEPCGEAQQWWFDRAAQSLHPMVSRALGQAAA